jgi:hypothetical protein
MTQQYPPPQSPYSPHGDPPLPEPTSRAKKPRRWPWVLGIIAALFVGMGIGGGSSGAGNTASTAVTTKTVTVEAPAPAAPTPAAAAPAPQQAVEAPQAEQPATSSGPATSFGSGQWSSPDEVQPGTYRSPGPEGTLCYADTTPANGGNIDQQEVSNGGPVRIRVKAGQIVKTSGCQEFTKVS